LPRNPLEAETSVGGSETGSGSGVGAETSLKVGSDPESDLKQNIPDPQPWSSVQYLQCCMCRRDSLRGLARADLAESPTPER
jgi:hypothetical protein